ncbi:hypothetical protein V5O48_005823 [Marasmius crinis-equi]|uniref:CxC2-like cysteine cluster KDZ transposase-associated domain-containing protein n=1 Tax=Marasmius crinis-equi TaxID=585013 RepID=A0ABR3FLW7_9AGAR
MSKRRKGAVYRDRVELAGDHEIVRTREEALGKHGKKIVVDKSPGKGRNPWTKGDSWHDWREWRLDESREFALDGDSEWFSTLVDSDIFDERIFHPTGAEEEHDPTNKKRKRTMRAVRPNIFWAQNLQEIFVHELLRHKGRGNARGQHTCPDCGDSSRDAIYRCTECFMGVLLCQSCCVRRHTLLPFHRVEKWTGSYFLKTDLRSMGLVIQLNHFSLNCMNPVKGHIKLRILHVNGIHHVEVRFCGCEKKVDHYIQLLRRKIYPASTMDGRIKTCATFEFLDNLQVHSFTSKCSTYDYYRSAELQTDGTGLRLPSSRYRQLMRMIRQWRYLHMLIRSGAGHQLESVTGDAAVEGRLILRCPSCPHPGINLPRGWNLDSPANRLLYLLRVCMDANFRLKEQLVSSHSRDPALTDGLGYFVKRKPYEAWVDAKGDSDEISNCVPFAALTKQNTKFSRGLRYTGVGGVSCGRSEMVMKLANLKKGERYSTMDYLFGVAMNMFGLLTGILLMYDICCQWIVRLDQRMPEWPGVAFVRRTLSVIPGVGKLHEPGHKQEDHQQYSLNLIPGAANTDGEAQERIWAEHNKLGNASRTMGPGARQDYLEAFFAFWNWLKYRGMGLTLRTRYAKALKDRNLQMEAHEGLTSNLPEALVKEWEGMCVGWEQASWPKANVFNPFEVVEEYQSQADCLRELALDEEHRLKNGGMEYASVSPAAFVVLVLDMRQSQLKDQLKIQTRDPTSRQATKVIEQRNAMRRTLTTLASLRQAYMPGLERYLQEAKLPNMNADVHPEDIVLYLPSDLPEDRRGRLCVPDLIEVEAKLQRARCVDALHGLRHTLRVKSRMILFKNTNVRGQRESGRSREVINRVVFRARAFAESYRESRSAYKNLVGGGTWESQLRVLNDTDVRSLRDPALVHVGPGRRGTNEEDIESRPPNVTPETSIDLIPPDRMEWEHRTRYGTGETRRIVSWIWTAGGKVDLEDGADEEGNEVLRSEWCKSRARTKRAEEEVKLVKEEMRRTLEYLTWSATEWEETPVDESNADGTLREGMSAYRASQALVQLALRDSFREFWKQPLSEVELVAEPEGNEEESGDVNVYAEAEEEEEEEEGGEVDEQAGASDEEDLGVDYDIDMPDNEDDQ